MREFTEEQKEVLSQAKEFANNGWDFPNIILALNIKDAEILQQLVNDAGNNFFQLYSKDKESYNLWEKICDFIYSVFGQDYSQAGGVNGKNDSGFTPLHMLSGSPIMVEILLNMRADVNIKNVQEETPIFGAASLNKLDIVKMMHNAGADLNIKNDAGNNILAALIKDHHPDSNRDLTEIFKYLIEQGVDPNEKNQNTGKSALDMAKESEYSNSLQLIFNSSKQSTADISR